jgi:L-alanine-DL-glutamate epimerase-like enolase superfamily enzyme
LAVAAAATAAAVAVAVAVAVAMAVAVAVAVAVAAALHDLSQKLYLQFNLFHEKGKIYNKVVFKRPTVTLNLFVDYAAVPQLIRTD